MISRRLKRLAPPEQRLVEFRRPFDRRAEQRFCEIMKILVRRIKQNDAPIRKQPRKQPRKRAAQSFPRTIRLAQPSRDLGIPQQRRGALDHRLNLRPKLDVPTGASRRLPRLSTANRSGRPSFRKQRHMVDLGQIVILGRQPENRNAIHSGRRRLFRQLDRRQRLEDRKQRPAKQTDLLPRNRRQRPAPKPLNIGQRLRRSAPRRDSAARESR